MESPKSKTHTILRFFNILIFGDRPKIRKTQINRSIHSIFTLMAVLSFGKQVFTLS